MRALLTLIGAVLGVCRNPIAAFGLQSAMPHQQLLPLASARWPSAPRVDLSRIGSIERIVSFVGVGLLMLVLGYFSPLPLEVREPR